MLSEPSHPRAAVQPEGGTAMSSLPTQRAITWRHWAFVLTAVAGAGTAWACSGATSPTAPSPAAVSQGKDIFRFDTFGDETFWTDALRLHEVVQTISPATALSVGLKVDADTLPPAVLAA